MNIVTVVSALLGLVAGMGIFLVACSMLSGNLQSLGGGKLFTLLTKTSNNKLLNVGIGTIVTAAIQSSSAVTVMIIGAVDAGMMSLVQAAGIVFGANIGTTVTGLFVALGASSDGALTAATVFAAFTGIGAAITVFARTERTKHIGGALTGFGMIFVGLSVMNGSMSAFTDIYEVREFLAVFRNPVLLVLIGASVTAVIQSSSAMTCMTITSITTSLITLNQGIYITIGANIGTCVTAVIAATASGKNAKRVAMLHLIFNVGGAALFVVIGAFLGIGGTDYGYILQSIAPYPPQLQLALFHVLFNVMTVGAALPAIDALVKLTEKIVPDKSRRRRIRKKV